MKHLYIIVAGGDHRSIQAAKTINFISSLVITKGIDPVDIVVANESDLNNIDNAQGREKADRRSEIYRNKLNGSNSEIQSSLDNYKEILFGNNIDIIKNNPMAKSDLEKIYTFKQIEIAQDIVSLFCEKNKIQIAYLEKSTDSLSLDSNKDPRILAQHEDRRVNNMANKVSDIIKKRPDNTSTVVICNVGSTHIPTLTWSIEQKLSNIKNIDFHVDPMVMICEDVLYKERPDESRDISSTRVENYLKQFMPQYCDMSRIPNAKEMVSRIKFSRIHDVKQVIDGEETEILSNDNATIYKMIERGMEKVFLSESLKPSPAVQQNQSTNVVAEKSSGKAIG